MHASSCGFAALALARSESAQTPSGAEPTTRRFLQAESALPSGLQTDARARNVPSGHKDEGGGGAPLRPTPRASTAAPRRALPTRQAAPAATTVLTCRTVGACLRELVRSRAHAARDRTEEALSCERTRGGAQASAWGHRLVGHGVEEEHREDKARHGEDPVVLPPAPPVK